jgi:bla regulator protein BlaR1
MTGPTTAALAAGLLVDAGLKSTVLLGLGWAATQALSRGSAAQRHAVWTATFAALPLLPVLASQRGAAVALDAAWLVPVWCAGAALASAPLVAGLVGLARISRRTTPSARVPGAQLSDDLDAPVTWGILRPVLALPRQAEAWPHDHLAAAVAHERAHIARRDWLVHVLVWAVSAAFWFHPLVWWARRALMREAELAADDAVLAHGTRPSVYAALLLSFAPPGRANAGLGVGGSLLGLRVAAVLDDRSRSPRRWPAWAAAAGLCAVALPGLGAAPAWTAPPDAPLTCEPTP